MEECSPCSTSSPFYTFQPLPPNTPNRFVFLINSLKHGQITVTRSLKIAKSFPSPLVPRKTHHLWRSIYFSIFITMLRILFNNSLSELFLVWFVCSVEEVVTATFNVSHSQSWVCKRSFLASNNLQQQGSQISTWTCCLWFWLSLLLNVELVRENHFPVCKQLFYPIVSVLCVPGAFQFCEVPFINCWS